MADICFATPRLGLLSPFWFQPSPKPDTMLPCNSRLTTCVSQIVVLKQTYLLLYTVEYVEFLVSLQSKVHCSSPGCLPTRLLIPTSYRVRIRFITHTLAYSIRWSSTWTAFLHTFKARTRMLVCMGCHWAVRPLCVSSERPEDGWDITSRILPESPSAVFLSYNCRR